MDPVGGVAMITILGMFSIWSFYYVFSQVFSKKEGLIASFAYAISFYTVFNDREVVPTMPVIVWTVWFFYGLDLLLKGKQKKGFLVLGILMGLIWHLNVTLVILFPLVVISLILSKKKVKFEQIKLGFLFLVLFFLPLILFELRHGLLQVKAFYVSLTTHQGAVVVGSDKFWRVIHLMGKNATGLIWGSFENISYEATLVILILMFVFLVVKRAIKKKQAILLSSWTVLYIVFFSFYSKILSEYYLNGTIFVWIFVFTLCVSYLLSRKDLKELGLAVLVVFSILNFDKFINIKINRSGYVERKATVGEIKRDAEEHKYECVAISYITELGYEFGYRYFFWQEGMHVNRPVSGSPVYTIVFPLRDDIEAHKTYGAIGLIYPDYAKYTEDGVKESCSGENSNLTEPMFGFTN